MSIFEKAAIEVAKKNQYSCHAVEDQTSSANWISALRGYANQLGPSEIPYRKRPFSKNKEYWWNQAVNDDPEKSSYAHTARVFALLLAHQMVLTGDIVL